MRRFTCRKSGIDVARVLASDESREGLRLTVMFPVRGECSLDEGHARCGEGVEGNARFDECVDRRAEDDREGPDLT